MFSNQFIQSNKLTIPLGLINFFFPLIAIGIMGMTSNVSFDIIFSKTISLISIYNLINFWILFPIAGICIVLQNRWSYSLVIAIHLFSIFNFLINESLTWEFLDHTLNFSPIILILFNIFNISILLIPSFRDIYFKKKYLGKNTKPRYMVEFNCKISLLDDSNTIIDGIIKNISKTGLFLIAQLPKDFDANVKIIFDYYDTQYVIDAKIVSQHTTNKVIGYGLKFNHQSFSDKITINKLVKNLLDNHDIKQRWQA